jgi:hypothetical protein
MPISVARFLDAVDGVQSGEFTVGSHETISSLSDLEPKFRQLIDEPVTAIISVTGATGPSNLTPVWFDYEDDALRDPSFEEGRVPSERPVDSVAIFGRP